MMKKKLELILVGVFVTVLLTFICVPIHAQAETIKLNYAAAAPSPVFPSVQMERWKVEVEKRTGGKVTINTFPGGALLGDRNMFDGVIAGQADIGVLVMAYQPGRFMLTNALSLPFGFQNARVTSLTLWDLYRKYNPEAFAKVKVLTMFATAPANIMSKKPVRGLDDIKGLSLRASGGAAMVLKSWGANPVGMPMTETPEALQKNVVQGLLSSLEVMKDFKFAELCRYVTITNSVVYPFAVVINRDSWNSLPKDVQKVMEDMSREQSEWTANYMDKHAAESIEWSKRTYNVEIINLTPEKKEKWDNLLRPITNKWIEDATAKGLPAKAIITDIKAFAKKHSD
jgi:TRAP-type C4-dicarboxylate transport system substrate-binding protein